MKKGIWILVIIIILIIIGVAFSGKSSTPSLEKGKELGPIKIGAALMLTGPTAQLGELQQRAIGMAVDKINSTGGINGRPLEIVTEDSGYDPKTAVSAYQALKLKGLHNFFIDGSAVIAVTHQLVVDDGNFTLAAIATAPSYFDGSDHTCRIAMTARNIGPAMNTIAEKRGYKKVAMLLPDNEYGRGFADEFRKPFEQRGGKVIVAEFYSAAPGTSDFRTNITKIKSVQPTVDAIIFSQVFTNIEPMLRQMKEMGITKPLISEFPTVTNPSLKDISLVEGMDFVNAEYSQLDLATDSQETKEFKAAYRAKYGQDPIFFAASHYDAMLLYAKALATVGEDSDKLAKYVSSLKDYQGITGTYSFNSDCEVDRKEVLNKVVGGKFVEFK